MNLLPFVNYKGRVLVGEGYGTTHVDILDFSKHKPGELATLDDNLWNDFSWRLLFHASQMRRINQIKFHLPNIIFIAHMLCMGATFGMVLIFGITDDNVMVQEVAYFSWQIVYQLILVISVLRWTTVKISGRTMFDIKEDEADI